jgi:peptidoglycan/xylan/chitin deacetylase (PgdA/CDA1 family)
MDHDRYPFWPLPERPALRWPNGARVAVWIIPNIEHFHVDKRIVEAGGNTPLPDVPSYASRDYGNRIGIWRLMDCLDQHGIRGTVALNSDVCRFEPQVVRAGMERGWEWMGHGMTNSERLSGMSEEQERQTIRTVVETIADFTGVAPRGWLGPAMGENFGTLDILAEHGIQYVCDWTADDQPFPLRVKQGRLISIPYTGELNDIRAFIRQNQTPEQFCQFICDQFDVLYEEGARSGQVMAIALHPFLIGHPFRIKWLNQALTYLTRHKEIWLTTGGEIADWYFQHYYDQAPK